MILMIDNYDSFTWNVVQYFWELGAEDDEQRKAMRQYLGDMSIAAQDPASLEMNLKLKSLESLMKEREEQLARRVKTQ